MAEALGAAGSIVGIVGFALQLSNTLQVYVETVAECEEIIKEIVFDINSTASALQQLQKFLEDDGKHSGNDVQPGSVTRQGQLEAKRLASKCERVYNNIVTLVIKASGKGEGEESLDETLATLQNLQTVTFSRKLRWPWLHPKIQRSQNELRWLKVSLMFQLIIFQHGQGASRDQQDAKVQEARWSAAEKLLIERRLALEKLSDNNVGNERHRGPGLPGDNRADDREPGPPPPIHLYSNPLLLTSPRQLPVAEGSHQASDIKRTEAIMEKHTIPNTIPIAHSTGELKPKPKRINGKEPMRPNPQSGSGEADDEDYLHQEDEAETDHTYPLGHIVKVGLYAYCIDGESSWQKSPFSDEEVAAKMKELFGGDAPSIWDQYMSLEDHHRKALDSLMRYAAADTRWTITCRGIHPKPARSDTSLRLLVFLSCIPQKPVYISDCLGRQLQVPYELCKSWDVVEKLVLEAFNGHSGIYRDVEQGLYILVGPHNQLVLPGTWASLVQPGWKVAMMLQRSDMATPMESARVLAGAASEFPPVSPWTHYASMSTESRKGWFRRVKTKLLQWASSSSADSSGDIVGETARQEFAGGAKHRILRPVSWRHSDHQAGRLLVDRSDTAIRRLQGGGASRRKMKQTRPTTDLVMGEDKTDVKDDESEFEIKVVDVDEEQKTADLSLDDFLQAWVNR